MLLVPAIAGGRAADPALELQLTQVHGPDVVHLIADMRAQDVILVRPATEQRVDIPRQRISPLALRQQMLNRLGMKAAQRGDVEIIVPTCQLSRFVPLEVPKNEAITMNYLRLSAGVALALTLENAGLRMRAGWKTPDVDLMIRVHDVHYADLIPALAAAVDVDVVVRGGEAELRPRHSNPACPAGIYEHIDTKAIPKRAKNEIEANRFSTTACGAKPNLLLGERDDSALKIAATMRYIGAARALLDGGADINLADEKLRSPVYMAASIGAIGMVEFLLGRGADPRQQSQNGMTPFTMAAVTGNVEVVKRMLASGVRIDEKDRNGYTMLTIAQEVRKTEMVEFLRARGAEPGAAPPR
jgi:hypothetical protein